MSYYDYNDHFWSPKEVCGQLAPKTCQKRGWGGWKLTGVFGGVFTRKYGSAKPDLVGTSSGTPPA